MALLEARDRVGGRTFTEVRDDGTWIDRGGAWIGPGQDRIYALMNEFGVPSYKQYTDGEAMMVVDGKQHRYTGTIPLVDEPVGDGESRRRLARAGPDVQDDPAGSAVGSARSADKWDSITLGEVAGPATSASKPAHDLLETAIAGCYTSAASEVSMLFVLYQMASGGGPEFVLGVKDGSQDSRIVGGMGAVYAPMAAEIGDSLHLSQPVRRIDQDADGVTVRSDDMTVRARRVIVAVPIAIASQILYEPMLPVDRSFLHQRMPSGAIFKINIVYDEPFWRADGLSGQSAAPGSPATVTIDACTDAGTPGRPVRHHRRARSRDSSASSTRPSADERSWPSSSDGSATRPRRRSTTSSRTGPSNAIPAAGCSATRRRACSPSSDPRCVSRAAASTGPGPRARRSCADGSTAPSAPGSAPRRGDATRTGQHGVTVGRRRGTTRYDNRSDRIQ